jgi:2-iminoacetate synthase
MSFSELWQRQDFAATGARIAEVSEAEVRRALTLASAADARLGLRELEALLSPAAAAHLETLATLSQRLTRTRFGRTVQLYAPLYLSNACANVCTYCGFSASNKLRRKTLSPAELEPEAAALERLGFEHVLLVTGEASQVGPDYLEDALRQLRPRFANLSLEVQPLDVDDYVRLARAGASAVFVYQETYDAQAYSRHHLKGAKKDMTWRLDTPDRLGRAGLHKVGLGALYGLSDWRADTWAVGLHLRYLEARYWKTRYSVSFPRLRPHAGEAFTPTAFDERDLVQAACALRLFCPEAELALSTRESVEFRRHAFSLAFTHLSAGSKTNPGGYTQPAEEPGALEQFSPHDERSPAEVAAQLRADGYEPVWKDWDPSFDARAE